MPHQSTPRVITIEIHGDCWIPTNLAPGSRGYARVGGVGSTLLHRRVYLAAFGPLPSHIELHHTCFNRMCCNPEHLVPMTKSAHSQMPRRRPTHCKRGHPFSPENTYMQSHGRRGCRSCQRARTRAWRQRKRR